MKTDYKAKIKIKNYNNLLLFVNKLKNIDEYQILPKEDKIRIIMSYPIVIQTF